MSNDRYDTKFEHSMDNLKRGVEKVFESASGEIWIDEPDAPDRNNYDDQEDGYLEYLYDLHEWALEGYREAVEEYQEAVQAIDAEEYPELGMHRKEDEAIRREIRETLEAISDKRRTVLEWQEKLDRVEEGFRKREEDGRAPI